MPLYTPTYSHDFADHTHRTVDGLFDVLYAIDQQIADCGELLNRSQPLLSGKVGVAFGVVQRHANGLALSEPYRVRLFLQKNKSGSRWVIRRISSTLFKSKDDKTENFLAKGYQHRVGGVTRNLALENSRVSVIACRALDSLFKTRSEIKKRISGFNAAYTLTARSHSGLQKKIAATLSKAEGKLEVDFSNPDLAYKQIAKKILYR